MTHVLDEAIAAIESDIRGIREHGPGVCDTDDDYRKDSVAEIRSMVAALRILRAERDGTRGEGHSEAVAAIEEIAGLLRCDTGHVADTLGTVREMLGEYSRLGSRITAWLDEARAEGRREERERVVAWLRDQSDRLANERAARPPYTGARDEDAVADALLYAIEDGDHLRGGEG